MKKWLVRITLFLVVALIAAAAAAYWEVEDQGLSERAWSRFDKARVRFDARGIPTIEGASWPEVIEAQGYVIASERLFQMDLMRRAAAGRLSEWFGAGTLSMDREHKLEDWEEVANKAYAALPQEERDYVEAYRRGVNRFIAENPRSWGLEYLLLGETPEPWEGRDTLLILLIMCDELTSSSSSEADWSRWKKYIGPDWSNYLFTQIHPWNQPMFGVKEAAGPKLPHEAWIAQRPIDAEDQRALDGALALASEAGSPDSMAEEALGSNNWAWCGKTGCFVANDPHLGASVPALWFANRMRVADDDWVAGVSIPGLPGVSLGMNAHLAWAFTNVGEDVDDLLREELSPDGKQYLAAIEGGEKVWKPVVEKRSKIRIRGGSEEEVVARFTHRGPLSKREDLDGWYSRAWLPLREGMLRLPTGFLRAKNWEELNAALDTFKVPAQNVLFADRKGNIGYRASGTGILRRRSGLEPLPALEGEWLGYAPASTRPRLIFYPTEEGSEAKETRFLATANERIWVDPFGQRWSDEQRKERIRRALSSRDDFTRGDMEALQRDTESRYRKLLLDWAIKNGGAAGGQARARVVARWSKWNGVATDDVETFSDAIAVDRGLMELCLARVRKAFLPAELKTLEYDYWLRTAWIIATLEEEQGTLAFGLEPHELAEHLVDLAVARAERKLPAYPEGNRWKAQHPLAGAPGVGGLFRVDTPLQYGWRGVVKVEQPGFGASVRLVWDLRDPANSTWSLPVGQSGHVRSPHYHDLQAEWFAGKPFPVFDESWKPR